jgi:hypothetical protein
MPATTQTISANSQRITFKVGDAASNMSLHCRGTFAGVNCTFEGSMDDGQTWFGVEATRSVGSVLDSTTGALSAAPSYSWDIECGGYSHVSVRSTAFTSGSQIWSAAAYAGGLAGAPVVAGSVGVSALPALPAGTNAIGDIGIQARANATGAASVRHVVAAATTNAAVVKASAGRLLGFQLFNSGAAAAYVKLHNSATTPTAGAGVFMAIPLPAGASVSIAIPVGIGFSAGIGMTIVQGAADTDATAVALNQVVGHLAFA